MKKNLERFSVIEFFHEEEGILEEIKELRMSMDDFSVYLPATQVRIEDEQKAKIDILVDLRERLNSYITKIDHSFALSNYKYVFNNIQDPIVKDIYKVLGPFDHF